MFELFYQFALELLRALLIDALSERVRKRLLQVISRRQAFRRARFYGLLKTRHSRRLLHKLRTLIESEVQ